MAKLSDAEYTERGRAATRRRTARYQQRLSAAGKTALTVWIPETLRTQIDGIAAQSGASVSDTVTLLIETAVTTLWPRNATTTPNQTTTTTNRNASNDATVDMFGATGEPSAPAIPQAERDQQILELHRQGLSNYAVADKAGCSEATVRRTLKRYNPESSHD